MRKLAVFASGSGSNFQALADAVQAGKLNARIVLLVCDKSDAYVMERARACHVPVFLFSPKDYSSKPAFEQHIVQQLREHEADFVILAGYMRLIGDTLLSSYKGRIINIHPSLLPNFAGKDAIGQALAAGVKETGVTIHYVDEGMDTGPIIAQRTVAIEDGETHESLQQKIQAVEHALYAETIQNL